MMIGNMMALMWSATVDDIKRPLTAINIRN